MVIYGPRCKYQITVMVTDIDCGYCRKHSEMERVQRAGHPRIRYLFYPRSGSLRVL